MDIALVQRLEDAAAHRFPGRGMLAAYVYGSRVSGRFHPASDLDVGYYLRGYRRGERLALQEEMALAADLSSDLDLTVDLRNLADAPLELKGRVLEEGIRIYSENEVERVALERELLGRYHDYKEVFRNMHEIRLRSLASRGL